MVTLARWSPSDSVPELTGLLHRAYKRLGDAGLNFTAVDQDDAKTGERLEGAIAFVAKDGRRMVGFASAHPDDGTLLYRQPCVRVIGPVAVDPAMQGQGLGRSLLATLEDALREVGIQIAALDTAKPATWLIAWYERLGFEVVGDVAWRSKTYVSSLMAKPLWPGGALIHPARPEDSRALDLPPIAWVARRGGAVVGHAGLQEGPRGWVVVGPETEPCDATLAQRLRVIAANEAMWLKTQP